MEEIAGIEAAHRDPDQQTREHRFASVEEGVGIGKVLQDVGEQPDSNAVPQIGRKVGNVAPHSKMRCDLGVQG